MSCATFPNKSYIGCDRLVRLRGGGVGRFCAGERRRWPALPVVSWWRHHRPCQEHNQRMPYQPLRHTQSSANDPSIDPVLPLILRYTRPVALIGMAFALSAIAWALSL
jgi:hypothetical protein